MTGERLEALMNESMEHSGQEHGRARLVDYEAAVANAE